MSILRQNITILNMCMRTKRESNCVRQELIKLQGKIDESTVTVVEFSILLTQRDISSRQKISKGTADLKTLSIY